MHGRWDRSGFAPDVEGIAVCILDDCYQASIAAQSLERQGIESASSTVNAFNNVEKQLAGDDGDTVLSFFTTIPVLLEGLPRR